MNVLEINNVTKRFGNLVAVCDVSLNVAKGELCAIIGPNGAGKTTFFNLISGYFPPTSGTIMFDGQDITRLATHERVTRGMARTFQITEIFPDVNGPVLRLLEGENRKHHRRRRASRPNGYAGGSSVTASMRDNEKGTGVPRPFVSPQYK